MKLITKYKIPLKAVLVANMLIAIVMILGPSGTQSDTNIAELSK